MRLPFGGLVHDVAKTTHAAVIVSYADRLTEIENAPQGSQKAKAILSLLCEMKGDDFYRVFQSKPNTELQITMRDAGSHPNAKTIAQLCMDPDSKTYFAPAGFDTLQVTYDPQKADAAWTNAFKLINAFAMSGAFNKKMGFIPELNAA